MNRKRKRLKSEPDFDARRGCEILGIKELEFIDNDSDLRLLEYRREYFLRFYGFHLKYRSHPGGVYFLLPYIFNNLNLTEEEKLWFCFINGCTQNPCTSLVILSMFPDLNRINISKLEEWHSENWKKLDYDIDKRYSKGYFVENVKNYQENLKGRTQQEYFNTLCPHEDKGHNFMNVWFSVMNNFYLFGRLGSFSYLEYLKIAGIDIECKDLFFDDISGSKSHRNGMLKVLGRDEYEIKKKGTIKTHSKELVEWVEKEAAVLLQDARNKYKGQNFYNDIDYFTMESALCTFKSQFRVNRRYPNVYMDMLHDRIKKAEAVGWDHLTFDIFWQARRDNLPKYLRIEDNPNDPGLCPEKQNHFRETGRPVMMWLDDNNLQNNFNQKYYK